MADVREELIEALLTSGEFNVYAKANRRWYAARVADGILASPVIARIRAEAIVSLADQLVDESIAVNNNAIGKPQAEWLLSFRQAERLSIAAEVIRAHASIRSGSEEDR